VGIEEIKLSSYLSTFFNSYHALYLCSS